jgi:hypothetical protein
MSIEDLKQLSDEEIDRLFHEDTSNEDVFEEYRSRLDWKTPPAFSSPEEETQYLEQLIASKTN